MTPFHNPQLIGYNLAVYAFRLAKHVKRVCMTVGSRNRSRRCRFVAIAGEYLTENHLIIFLLDQGIHGTAA